MKTNLSEIEQLRLDKVKLKEECTLFEEDIKHRINYSKDHLGRLLLNTAMSSVKEGFSEITAPRAKRNKNNNNNEADKDTSLGIGSILFSATPFIWEIIQPVLLGLALKKAKSLFTRKIKRK